jgi:hypothetical protein
MPTGDRSARGRAVNAARHGEHEADEHEGLSRHVRENQCFGLSRLKVKTVVAVAPVLRMEVEARCIPRPAQASRVVSGRGCGAGISPTTGNDLDLPPKAFRSGELRRVRE